MAEQMNQLQAIMVEEGDLDLFPDEVVAAYNRGVSGPERARSALRKAMSREKNERRKQLQAKYLASYRLWATQCSSPILFTFNGMGTMLYGAVDMSPDDYSYISTLWLTFLFVPLLPVASYWVKEREDSSYFFLGKTRHPPRVWGIFAAVLFFAFAATNTTRLAGFTDYLTSGRADLVVYNGFSKGVTVTVGDEAFELTAGGHEVLSMPAEETPVVATFIDGTFIESFQIDLEVEVPGYTLYNVGNRAWLYRGYVVYGEDIDIPDSEPLFTRVSYPGEIEYLFTDPPQKRRTESAHSMLAVAFMPALEGVDNLLSIGLRDEAIQHGRAALLDGHDDIYLIDRVGTALTEKGESLGAFCSELVAAYPDQVVRHRYCQNVSEAYPDELRARYEEHAAAKPGSAMYAYLAGRVQEDFDSRQAWWAKSLVLDPSYDRSRVAIANDLLANGDFAEALGHFRQLHTRDSYDRRLEVLTRQLLGESSLSIAAALDGESGDLTLGELLTVQGEPARYGELVTAVKGRLDADIDSATRANLIANVALAAGHLDELRRYNRAGAGFELYAALSEGATEEDRAYQPPPEPSGASVALLSWVLAITEGHDATAYEDAIERAYPGTLALLRQPDLLTEAGLREHLFGVTPGFRAEVWFAAYRLTGNEEFGRRAYDWSVPTQLPWFVRPD